MPECTRCGAFTDQKKSGRYRYCLNCQDIFNEIEENGIVVENHGGTYTVSLTADVDHELDSGEEPTEEEALARALKICDEADLRGVYRFHETGSRWVLSNFLDQHPSQKAQVYARLGRTPEQKNRTILDRIRSIFR